MAKKRKEYGPSQRAEMMRGLAAAAKELKREEESKMMTEHCKRPISGTERAWFHTRAEAEAFANNPTNHPVYLGDVACLCKICGWWHLSKLSWLTNTSPSAAVN